MSAESSMVAVPKPGVWHLSAPGERFRLTHWRADMMSVSVQDGGVAGKLLRVERGGEILVDILLDETSRAALVAALQPAAQEAA